MYFKGQIAEVRIWNRARSQSEIWSDMRRQLSGDEPGLVGYWRFEDGKSRDHSGKGNHGTVKGNPQSVASPLHEPAEKVIDELLRRISELEKLLEKK